MHKKREGKTPPPAPPTNAKAKTFAKEKYIFENLNAMQRTENQPSSYPPARIHKHSRRRPSILKLSKLVLQITPVWKTGPRQFRKCLARWLDSIISLSCLLPLASCSVSLARDAIAGLKRSVVFSAFGRIHSTKIPKNIIYGIVEKHQFNTFQTLAEINRGTEAINDNVEEGGTSRIGSGFSIHPTLFFLSKMKRDDESSRPPTKGLLVAVDGKMESCFGRFDALFSFLTVCYDEKMVPLSGSLWTGADEGAMRFSFLYEIISSNPLWTLYIYYSVQKSVIALSAIVFRPEWIPGSRPRLMCENRHISLKCRIRAGGMCVSRWAWVGDLTVLYVGVEMNSIGLKGMEGVRDAVFIYFQLETLCNEWMVCFFFVVYKLIINWVRLRFQRANRFVCVFAVGCAEQGGAGGD